MFIKGKLARCVGAQETKNTIGVVYVFLRGICKTHIFRELLMDFKTPHATLRAGRKN